MTEDKKINLPVSKTIHKKNEIIRGEILLGKIKKDKNAVLELNPTTIKLFNFVYMHYQNNYEGYKDLDNKMFSIELMTLKKELEINSNNYSMIIKSSLKELFEKEIEIKDFIDNEGNKVLEYHTHFIKTYKVIKDPNNNNNVIFNIEFDNALFEYINNKDVFFTELKFENYKKLNRGHQIRLYEYLKSYENMKNRKTPELNLLNLNKIFSTNFEYLSHVEKILKRSIAKINKDTDIEVSYLKFLNKSHEKVIQFTFISDRTFIDYKKQKLAIDFKSEESEMIENLLRD